jgi:E3 ubiquitin-protein ligase DOA10
MLDARPPDVVTCRICYDGASHADDALLSDVCACKGSIGHIHRSCLRRIARYDHSGVCTICRVAMRRTTATARGWSRLGVASVPVILLCVGGCVQCGLETSAQATTPIAMALMRPVVPTLLCTLGLFLVAMHLARLDAGGRNALVR